MLYWWCRLSPWAAEQTFQHCFNVVFWLIRRYDVEKYQINFETMLCISTLEFKILCISTSIWTMLGNIEPTLYFSRSSFTTLVNEKTASRISRKWLTRQCKYALERKSKNFFTLQIFQQTCSWLSSEKIFAQHYFSTIMNCILEVLWK